MDVRDKRFGVGVKLGAAALALSLCGITAWASIDTDGPPTWSLEKTIVDPDGNFAMLLPSNDTRVNFYLLLADRRGVPVPVAKPEAGDPPFALFPWKVLAKQIAPQNFDSYGQYQPVAGSRCQTNASGSAGFAAAVSANGNIPADERQRLIAARHGLDIKATPVEQYSSDVECGSGEPKPARSPEIGSADGKEFAAYLLAARVFYEGNFDDAAQRFKSLTGSAEPWVRETASYMTARTLLNRAVRQSMDEFGSLNEPNMRDSNAIAAAGAALEDYLRAYPVGRYASSARGLIRRVHWLAGDDRALAEDYARQLADGPRCLDGPSASALIEEVDSKLLTPDMLKPDVVRDPMLVAVMDLRRMRDPSATGEQYTRDYCCGPAITAREIEAQRPLFRNDIELYDYIRAAQAYFVRHDAAEVLRLIPDAARQKQFSYLQFSRQMLRGLALQSVGDPNTHDFWLSLFAGSTQPYQRQALELALAVQEEKSGRLDLVFAPDSPVQHPVMRALLLEYVAGPRILRQQAIRSGAPRIERDTALYILLSKELRRGFYDAFLKDVRLLPPNASVKTYERGVDVGFWGFSGAGGYNADYNTSLLDPPLGVFGSKGNVGDFGCPALAATVVALAENPRAIHPRLCLAEFFRNNRFDDFEFDEPFAGMGLASTRPLFPAGTPYSPKDSRLEFYKSVIRDPFAAPDDKAMAFNRAVRCYAPSGGNSCGGTEVPLAQRRAWFLRLKAGYPTSRWAKELHYYW